MVLIIVTLAARVTCTAAAAAAGTQREKFTPSLSIISSSQINNSDSNLDIKIITSLLPEGKMSTTGPSVIHTVYNHPPTVTEGELTLKIVMEFEQACQTFFNNVKGGIPEEQKVAHVLPAFKDTLICDWIASSRNDLIGLTFNGFLEELWKKQLPHNWEDKLRTQILSERLRGDSQFST